jgi:hypothetical protein
MLLRNEIFNAQTFLLKNNTNVQIFMKQAKATKTITRSRASSQLSLLKPSSHASEPAASTSSSVPTVGARKRVVVATVHPSVNENVSSSQQELSVENVMDDFDDELFGTPSSEGNRSDTASLSITSSAGTSSSNL